MDVMEGTARPWVGGRGGGGVRTGRAADKKHDDPKKIALPCHINKKIAPLGISLLAFRNL